MITIGVSQFGANRLPMSTTLRGWFDFPPVLQDGGEGGVSAPQAGAALARPACLSPSSIHHAAPGKEVNASQLRSCKGRTYANWRLRAVQWGGKSPSPP